jgi:hypothetical protein
MFERFSDGILGLFLFFAHWLSPGVDEEAIRIVSVRPMAQTYIVSCVISVTWNEQMKDLIDAGVPVRFLFRTLLSAKDTLSRLRTLQCDVADYSYAFCDSLRGPQLSATQCSKRFSHLLIALEKFTQWETEVPLAVTSCRIEVELLPTSAARLHRKIDMSQVCGYRFFAANFFLKSAR